jgi:hypothetical protein
VSDDVAVMRRAFRDIQACRIGTVRSDGGPHVAVRWFVWLEDAIWVTTKVGDATWEHATRDPRVSIVLDRGREWIEYTGVRIEGVAEPMPAEHPDLREPMSAWHDKYRSVFGTDGFERFTRDVPVLGFLRVAPSRVDVWDNRATR